MPTTRGPESPNHKLNHGDIVIVIVILMIDHETENHKTINKINNLHKTGNERLGRGTPEASGSGHNICARARGASD